LVKNRSGFRAAFRSGFRSGFRHRVQKTPKGNLPCGNCFWTNFFFQIAISQPLIEALSRYLPHIKTYIQGTKNDILHHHMTTTPYTMSFQTRKNVFIENFRKKIIFFIEVLLFFVNKNSDLRKQTSPQLVDFYFQSRFHVFKK
jgi:hypothetical protein